MGMRLSVNRRCNWELVIPCQHLFVDVWNGGFIIDY